MAVVGEPVEVTCPRCEGSGRPFGLDCVKCGGVGKLMLTANDRFVRLDIRAMAGMAAQGTYQQVILQIEAERDELWSARCREAEHQARVYHKKVIQGQWRRAAIAVWLAVGSGVLGYLLAPVVPTAPVWAVLAAVVFGEASLFFTWRALAWAKRGR